MMKKVLALVMAVVLPASVFCALAEENLSTPTNLPAAAEVVTVEAEAPAEEAAPAEEVIVEEAAPIEEEAPAEEAAPVEEEAPAEEAASTEEEAPAEEEVPAEEEAPAEEAAPVEEEAPAEEAAPAEEEAPAEEAAPVEEEVPAEEEAPAEEATEETGRSLSIYCEKDSFTEGELIYLYAMMEGYSANAKIQWYLNGEPIEDAVTPMLILRADMVLNGSDITVEVIDD